MSLVLAARNHKSSQLYLNLQTLFESGYSDIPYLCFSSAYMKVSDEVLKGFSKFPNLIVHITVSGWHSREENSLRLFEFERYSKYIPKTFLRIVNRQDWAGIGSPVQDSGARVEEWLLSKVEQMG